MCALTSASDWMLILLFARVPPWNHPLLTSLPTIAGLTPLLFETSRRAQFLIPMAVSVPFGLAFAPLIVLFLIPALLACIEGLDPPTSA